MPLVVICGIPASGKSRRARQLAEELAKVSKLPIVVLNDDGSFPNKSAAYRDATSEKSVRASFKAAVEREVSRDKIVIADSLNYIKGFRYELYCVSRAAATTHCVIHCDTPEDVARRFNETHEAPYDRPIFEDVMCRFERPQDRQRWDRPLFTVYPDDELDFAGIQQAIFQGQTLTPNLATVKPAAADSNLLHSMDKITGEMVAAILQHRSAGIPAPFITLPHCSEKLPAADAESFTAASLHRARRQFLTIGGLRRPEKIEDVGPCFFQFLVGGSHE